ncbi:MAG: MBL fold metallo-hydrolase RNA specificity domain-containing protein [Candidatus Woesearchaeota archaeon]
MTVELTAIGGFNEVGRQSTGIKVNDTAVIIDLGLHLDHYISYTDDVAEDLTLKSVSALRKAGAIPDWTSIKDWKNDVKGIILTHAHLDHVGAVPYLAHLFDCPIYGTPFTIELLKQLIDDKKFDIPNKLIKVKDKVTINNDITVEFVRNTHSTVDTSVVVLHTPYGAIVTDNDYKIDRHPTLGKPPNFARLQEIGKKKVIAHIAECLYAPSEAQTPSESVARKMLEEVLLEGGFDNRTVFVSTFSSHIARLNSIMQIGKAMGRDVVFMGRSMAKYLEAAKLANILSIPKHVRILKYGAEIRNFMKKNKDLSKFLMVCTGHMGEPKAALTKLVEDKLPFKFKPDDVVILSSSAIPVSHIIANRNDLLRKLKQKQVRIFDKVHVSGHASREDIRWMMKTINADNVIPNHGIPSMTESYISLARETGLSREQIHNLREGDRITLVK